MLLSRVYVDKIVSSLPSSQLHLNSAVRAVSTFPTAAPFLPSSNAKYEVHLQLASGRTEVFDHVILACHADTALEILRRGGSAGGFSDEEQRVLAMFQFNRNEVALHSDIRVCTPVLSGYIISLSPMSLQLMPQARVAWSCWNYLTYSEIGEDTGKSKANVNRVAL